MLSRIFPEQSASENTRFTVPVFLAVLMQLILLCGIIWFWELEKQSGLQLLLPWVIAGFTVNAFLPLRFRDAFFVVLTVSALLYLAGPVSGGLAACAVLAFIGIAHLPLPWLVRVVLLILSGGVLCLLHLQFVYAPRLTLAAGIAGLFVMFRLILYMYELKHEQKPAGFWQRLSYFFMLPNLCFPLFPIIDWKTWLRCKYSVPQQEIWRSGIRKLLRGCVHLIVYRFIYTQLVPSPATLTGPADLALYIATAYLLVLRMSGIFYIGIGILHLFGYNLPPIFNNFFLIPSFGEIWRRINIYWKDFVTKIIYYPLWFRLRKVKGVNAILITGLITFFFTWQLHSWQWFWVLGRFPFSAMDAVYWLTLGSVITVSLMIAEKRGVKTVAEKGQTIIGSLKTVLSIAGIFLFMSLLWSFWNSKSIGGWFYLLHHAATGSGRDYSLIAAVAAGIIAAGTVIHYYCIRYKIDNNRPMSFKATLLAVSGAGAFLLLPIWKPVQDILPKPIAELYRQLSKQQLSQYDRENNEQGYYEKLLEDPSRSNPFERRLYIKGKPGSELITVPDAGILQRRLKPNGKATIENYTISINRWGMRDRDYALEKAPGTYRIALLGGSYEMGSGINDGETYEQLIEELLNKQLPQGSEIKRIEILNFAVPGYHALQQVWLCEHEVFKFKPDMILYAAHSEDPRRLNGFFASLISNGVPLEYEFLKGIKARSGAAQGQSRDEIRNRLQPHTDQILSWSCKQIVQQAQQQNARAVWFYLPATADSVNTAERSSMQKQAADAGFETIVLKNPYGNAPRTMLQIGNGDTHPNAAGHKRIADALYPEISALLIKK
ncbi:MAG: hypothetical protein ACK5Z2_04985 [Bacteroidota bacterium]|jgi:hypothetical protein